MNEPAAPVSTRAVYAFGDGPSLPARRREAAPLLSSEPANDPLELPHPLIHPSPLTQVINKVLPYLTCLRRLPQRPLLGPVSSSILVSSANLLKFLLPRPWSV
jgi:hypothetical protein